MSKAIRPEWLILLFSVLLMAGYNQSLWMGIIAANSNVTLHTGLFFVSCAVFLTALFNLLFNFAGLARLTKPVLIFVLFCSAIASYFMDSYGIQVDSVMLQNVLETDSAEANELFSFSFIFHMLLWAALPIWFVVRAELTYTSWRMQTVRHLFLMTMSLLAIGLMAAFFYADYASTFRNHRELRYLINPTNYIYATTKSIKQQFAREQKPLELISKGTQLGAYAQHKQNRSVVVLVVGETARAESFHLDGYERQTTPELEKLDVLNFSHVHSCGTSTAVSLPCMFSMYSQDEYNDEKGHNVENLLDVVAASGTSVIWLDNNSGCKGICQRVENQMVSHLKLPAFCNSDECLDEVLLEALKNSITTHDGDLLVVLHQKGSHGPAYFKRVPEKYKQFLPVCETAEIQQCSHDALVNAYDNTILYTDKVLSDLVQYLDGLSSEMDTAMLYVSDHGESLGEKNIYLHGSPYLFAPSQQTHVPMLMWLSDNYKKEYSVDEVCLQAQTEQPLSQDNLFHSMLGMMNIELQVQYQSHLDIFASCHHNHGHS